MFTTVFEQFLHDRLVFAPRSMVWIQSIQIHCFLMYVSNDSLMVIMMPETMKPSDVLRGYLPYPMGNTTFLF